MERAEPRLIEAISRRTVLRRLALSPGAVAGLLAAVAAAAPRGAQAQAPGGRRCVPTGSDLEGPFYLPGAPNRIALAPPEEPGVRLLIRGRVLGPDCATPVAGALLDVWQADAAGAYYTAAEQYRFRGRLLTSEAGAYEVFSVLPGAYRIGVRFRPAHIHLKVTHRAYRPLTTQLYFRGDPYLAPNDACGRSCKSDDPGRVIELRREEKMGAEFLTGTFDIVLTPA